MRKKEVLPIPPAFDEFTGFNELKRKKLKSSPMSSSELDSHAQALYSILLQPVVNSTPSWQKAAEEIRQLADCFFAYKQHLDSQLEQMKHNQSQDHPCRSIGQDASLEHRNKTPFAVTEKYTLLDAAVRSAGVLEPVIFDETKHLKNPFDSNLQRHRFIEGIQLSLPIDIIRYNPGGSSVTILCICAVTEHRSEPQILTQGAQFLQQVRPALKEYHTRAQRKMFKQKLKNVAVIMPGVADLIYKELTLDASAADDPITQERLRLIFLGAHGLLADLRHLNQGRPGGKFDEFFEVLSRLVETKTAADDRRHNTAHLSEFLSLDDMISQAKDLCPDGTVIPSKSLVRLQFAPRNPYTHAALSFTSRIPVQFKIQRRQLRMAHPDDHYCNAQLKYLKQRTIELRGKLALFFCDDKAKVPFGDPGAPISTGVRGKKTIAPANTSLVALDHDMHKASLTPSVVLECQIPDSVEKSFVQGKVTTVINDAVFQSASPFRHAVVLSKILKEKDPSPPIVFKFTDGGTDQRNNLESVRCASICLFKELDLDMVVLARCAPGQSWINPAERVMSILNLGLQNVSLERQACSELTESYLKSCNSMTSIRELAESKPEIKEAWKESIEPVQSLIRNRFLRLKLKEETFQALDPVSDEDITNLKRHLGQLFPDMDQAKINKTHTRRVASYNDWVKKHCRMRQYTFQVRKCRDNDCCTPRRLEDEDLNWLPDPVLEEGGEHFKSYDEVKNLETTEKDLPSLKVTKAKKKQTAANVPQRPEQNEAGATANATEDKEITEHAEHFEIPVADSFMCSVQHARAIVTCVECRKPRVIYARQKLSERQNVSIVTCISENDYTCGAALLPPTHSLVKKVLCRAGLCCASPIEIPFYGSGLGRLDLCSFCGVEGGEVDLDLKKNYKTVLPICLLCREDGKTPIVQRPFGKT